MKVIVSRCYGGFGLSHEAILRYMELRGMEEDSHFADYDIPRDDPALVQVVEELGAAANGSSAELEVVIIPDGVDWEVEEYDGWEHVAEKHRIW